MLLSDNHRGTLWKVDGPWVYSRAGDETHSEANQRWVVSVLTRVASHSLTACMLECNNSCMLQCMPRGLGVTKASFLYQSIHSASSCPYSCIILNVNSRAPVGPIKCNLFSNSSCSCRYNQSRLGVGPMLCFRKQDT